MLEPDANGTARILLGGSSDAAARGRTLSAYLTELHAATEHGLERGLDAVRLLILTPPDWANAAPYPYGFTFFRRLRDGTGVIFAPADYPHGLLRVFRGVVERSRVNAPGSIEDFLDDTLGHELGHAAADQLGLRTRIRWLDEFLATYLYLAALRHARPETLERVVGWGRLLASDRIECALADAVLHETAMGETHASERPESARELERTDLGAFEFPVLRLPLANQAWFQARFTLHAADLLERRGWDFVRDAVALLPHASGRGGISRALVRLEPSFKPWFASFGTPQTPRAG